MLQVLFHAWERRLASVTTDRVVRPFEWGLDWIPQNGHPHETAAADVVGDWVSSVMADSDTFFTPAPTTDYTLTPASDGLPTDLSADLSAEARRSAKAEARSAKAGDLLTFPSAFVTPHDRNNTVHCRYFPAAHSRKAAVLVLPQWNSDPGGHVGLCKLLAWNGMSALRLSLPYHDQRMPPDLHRADYIVSANIARTVQVCRQVTVQGVANFGSSDATT